MQPCTPAARGGGEHCAGTGLATTEGTPQGQAGTFGRRLGGRGGVRMKRLPASNSTLPAASGTDCRVEGGACCIFGETHTVVPTWYHKQVGGGGGRGGGCTQRLCGAHLAPQTAPHRCRCRRTPSHRPLGARAPRPAERVGRSGAGGGGGGRRMLGNVQRTPRSTALNRLGCHVAAVAPRRFSTPAPPNPAPPPPHPPPPHRPASAGRTAPCPWRLARARCPNLLLRCTHPKRDGMHAERTPTVAADATPCACCCHSQHPAAAADPSPSQQPAKLLHKLLRA